MKCIVKCILLIMCLFFLISAFSQKRYGIGENCITINSIKFGKILMKTIGEDRLRELIKKNRSIVLCLKLNPMGDVQSVIKVVNSGGLRTEECNLIKKRILRNFFYVCYAEGDSLLIDEEIKEMIKKNHSLTTVVFFPGPLAFGYIRNKEEYLSKGIDESDYIISRLKN